MPELAVYLGREWNIEHDRRVKVSNAELRYAVVGDVEPVLCIHGTNIADSLITPLRFFPLFEEYKMISYYRAGYNGSTLEKKDVSIEEGAEHARQLLDELGIERTHVVAFSFGGVIAFQFLLSYTERVCGCGPSSRNRSPPTRRGTTVYAAAQVVQAGLRRLAHTQALTLPRAGYLRPEILDALGFASVDDYVPSFWEGFAVGQDPNNLICQARKARSANLAEGGDLTAALGRITAKATIVAFTGDVMFSPEDSPPPRRSYCGSRVPGNDYPSGHLTTFAMTADDRQAMDEAIREALAA